MPENNLYPAILLQSGRNLVIRSVLLYEELVLREIQAIRSSAAQAMGPVSSGIGFIGSPGWVLGASALVGLAEGYATQKSQQRGLSLLQQAEAKSRALIEGAVYCNAAYLQNKHLPHPELWVYEAVKREVVDVKSLGWGERGAFLKRYGKSSADIENGKLSIEKRKRYVHNGDEFLKVETNSGVIDVRWSAVVAFSLTEDRKQELHRSAIATEVDT